MMDITYSQRTARSAELHKAKYDGQRGQHSKKRI